MTLKLFLECSTSTIADSVCFVPRGSTNDLGLKTVSRNMALANASFTAIQCLLNHCIYWLQFLFAPLIRVKSSMCICSYWLQIKWQTPWEISLSTLGLASPHSSTPGLTIENFTLESLSSPRDTANLYLAHP
jgi:hypothetical protein